MYSTVSVASVFVVFICSFAAFFLWFQLPFCSGGRAEREGTNCVRGVNGKSMSQFVRKQHLEGAFVQTLANDFGNRSATFAGVDQAIKGCICLFFYGLVIEQFRASVGELKKTLKKGVALITVGGLFAGMVRARVFADRWTDLLPKIHSR